MTQKQRSPREAGNVRKLAGWARCNCSLLESVALAVLLAGALVWQGVAR